MKQEVEVEALRDQHIIGAAQPVAIDAPELGGVFHRLSSGIVRVYGGLKRGQTYTVYSYAPRPEPADLARIGAKYPAGLERFFDIGRTRVEPFGAAGRDAHRQALFDDERYVALWPYLGDLWNQAKLAARGRAGTPYGAVVAIETWLRSTGGFTYDESPPATGGLPPLAHFVSEGKRGYCQHFAGAMALMLRFLGIPARVAGGFTSGKHEGGHVGRDRSQRARLGRRHGSPATAGSRSTRTRRAGVADRELQRLVDGFSTPSDAAFAFGGRPGRRRKAVQASSSVCCRRSGWPNGRARAGPARTTAASVGVLAALPRPRRRRHDRRREGRPPQASVSDARSAAARRGCTAPNSQTSSSTRGRRSFERDTR
mgnify:CR=1 FL=1